MKNKGFTLIEILGIIVVLSVIAIVTIPMINNITSKTKKDAFRASVLSIFSAADYQVFNKDLTQILKVPEMKLDNNNFISGTATLINRNWVVENVGDGNYCANGTLTDLKIENGECDPSIPSCFFIVNSEQNEKGWYTEEIKLLMKTSTAEASGIEYGIGSTETYDHKIKRGQYGTIDITVSDTEEVEYICYVKTGKNNKSTNKIKLKVDTKKPTTPVITGGSEEWSNSYVEIKVSEESKSTSGIEKYMYHISETEEIKENGEWKDVEGLSVKIAKEGKYYVYFKSINNAGVESDVSNYQIIKIDRNAPEIELEQNKANVTMKFKDNVNLKGYQITKTEEEPTSWIDITGLSTTVTYEAESAGTYYIYVKDESGIISSSSFTLTNDLFCTYQPGQVVGTFNYNGGVQSVKLTCDGVYKLEVYGSYAGYFHPANGGYAVGYKMLKKDDILYICAGNYYGYNGGGANHGGLATTGGGATHIALNSNRGVLKNYSSYRNEVLIVAGGASGDAGYSNERWEASHPGGGLVGGSGGSRDATQTSGGAGGTSSDDKGNYYGGGGSFGQGGNGAGSASSGSAGGGGGGWYGGGGGAHRKGRASAGGAGSAYIGNVPAFTYKNVTYSPSTTTGVNSGNGYAKITYIAN